jgi:hypothetical protein
MNQHRWSLRISSGGRGRANVYVRQHQFAVGAPVQFDEQYNSVTALEYVLGAIGADVVNSLRIIARQRRVDIANVEALVSGSLNNPLTFLGVVGEEGHPGLETLTVRVYVSSIDPEEKIQQIWAETQEKSPLVRTFQPAIKLEMELRVVI